MMILHSETASKIFPTEALASEMAARIQADDEKHAEQYCSHAWKYSVEPHASGFVIVVHDDTGYRLGRL